MRCTDKRWAAVLALFASALFHPAPAQPVVPDSSLYTPKPSADLRWALGDWVAKGEHPVYGDIVEWHVTINANGAFFAELRRSEQGEAVFERGAWAAVDRDIMSFATVERDRVPTGLALPDIHLYLALAITADALELRHVTTGKLLRLERGST